MELNWPQTGEEEGREGVLPTIVWIKVEGRRGDGTKQETKKGDCR